MSQLPEGFTLDEADGLPPGFSLDEEAAEIPFARKGENLTPEQADEAIEGSLNVAGELAAGANAVAMAAPDTIAQAAIGGLRGLTELIRGEGLDEAVKAVREAPTLSDGIQALTGFLPGEGGFMEPGPAREAVRAAGGLIPVAAGLRQVPGRDITTVPGATAEFLGAGSAKVPVALDAELALKNRTGDVVSAGFKLDDAGKAIPDPVGRNAIKLGVDEGAVAMIKSAGRATRNRMRDMLDIVEEGQKNLKARNLKRPGVVVGQALEDRLSVVRAANRLAGEQVDTQARALKGKSVDYSQAIGEFMSDLDRHGIVFNPKNGTLNFSESSIEGLDEAQRIVTRMVRRLADTKVPDAFDVHRAKRFIDNQVTYGKTQAGLSGEMSQILKKLRRGLDSALDSTFPAYDEANTAYRETREVLDGIQSLAGARVDLLADNADRALGIMSRKILSNYASGTPMLNTFNDLDGVARKYTSPVGGQIGNTRLPAVNDDVVELASFEAEIRRMFPTIPPANSFQGEIGAEIARGASDVATGNQVGLFARGVGKLEKALSKTDKERMDAQIKALRALLKD